MKEKRRPPAAILWFERQAFLCVTARTPEIKLWSSLKKLLPLYQQSRTADLIGEVTRDNWYDNDQFPSELRAALDRWASENGYSDGWFKNIGAIQLYFWTADPDSLNADVIQVPCVAFSGLEEGVPPPSFFRKIEWRPYSGEQWQVFAKQARTELASYLRAYHQECLEACPSLASLHGYSAYSDVAKYQAGLQSNKLDESTWKQISRTAKRLGLTLRKRTQLVELTCPRRRGKGG